MNVATPARLPADVAARFFPSGRPAPVSPYGCEPTACPGAFVPLAIPDEIVAGLFADEKSILGKNRWAKVEKQWKGSFPEELPAFKDWPADVQDAALESMKFRAELAAREAYAGSQAGPWTARWVCPDCALWLKDPWAWQGVQAVRSTLVEGHPYLVTCGMLRDAGVISDEAGCQAQVDASSKKYRKYMDDLVDTNLWSSDRIFEMAVVAVISIGWAYVGGAAMAAAAVAAGAAAGGAAATAAAAAGATATNLALQALKDPKSFSDPEQLLSTLASAVARMAPVLGSVAGTVLQAAFAAAKVAYSVYRTIEATHERTAALDQQRHEIAARTKALVDLLQAQASLEEIRGATADLNRATGHGGGLGGLVLALAALLAGLAVWRRR